MPTRLTTAWRTPTSILALLLSCVPALAQDTAKATASTAKAADVADPRDLEAFFDGVINVQRDAKHIAGAVVAVVVGDKMVFAKGYGYADIENRRPVDPDKTMFRIASISKLFTWTAVMQQIEAGKVDLDTDVNKYLKDLQVPEAYGQPVTLKHLLTHTPGFDDPVIGLFARKAEDVRPLPEVLREQMPNRVRPPGVLSSYSNHGTAIAGYVVACVSGMPWEDYVEQRILKPLGMEHTLVRQPPEDQLPADLSKGYKWAADHYEVKSFEYVPAAPAGCISTSASDAARFMIAHLNDGQFGKEQMLKPEMARRMREPLFRHDPHVGAMCYGFMEHQQNGQRIVGHGGDTMWFHSLMELIPERRVGLFVSYNTDTSQGGPRNDLYDAFLRRYFPEPDPPRNKPAEGFAERAKRLAGEYGVTRYSHTSVTKLSALFGVLKVAANDDDTITIGTGLEGKRYVEIEPFVFREQDGKRQVVFKEDENGQVKYLFIADAAPFSTERREWYEQRRTQVGLLAASLALFLSALLYWPVIAFSVRGLSSPTIKRTRFSGVLSFLGWLTSLACLVFAGGLAFAVIEQEEIVFGLPPVFKYLLVLAQVCGVLAALTVLACLIAWIGRYWRLSGRLHFTLVALAGVGFTWFLYHWNLLPLELPAILN
jgi:CubicO group peptidase (beta-lactamase class C family)